MTGPAWTILAVDRLDTGQVRILVRKRGGRMVRLVVPAVLANGPDIERLVGNVITMQPPRVGDLERG